MGLGPKVTAIFVDGDACPMREDIYRVAGRLRLNVFVLQRLSTDPAARYLKRAHDFDR
jgi:uncharacterized protein YaiI (UPF0178 family)